VTLAVVAVGYVGVAVAASWPPSYDSYRQVVQQSIQDALSQVGTVQLMGSAAMAGRTWSAYEAATMSDARDTISTAIGDLTDEAAADEMSRQLRAQVLPLLNESATRIQDTESALSDGDTTAVSKQLVALAALRAKLQSVVQATE
jgi:hypothetical protein